MKARKDLVYYILISSNEEESYELLETESGEEFLIHKRLIPRILDTDLLEGRLILPTLN